MLRKVNVTVQNVLENVQKENIVKLTKKKLVVKVNILANAHIVKKKLTTGKKIS